MKVSKDWECQKESPLANPGVTPFYRRPTWFVIHFRKQRENHVMSLTELEIPLAYQKLLPRKYRNENGTNHNAIIIEAKYEWHWLSGENTFVNEKIYIFAFGCRNILRYIESFKMVINWSNCTAWSGKFWFTPWKDICSRMSDLTWSFQR